VIIASIDTTSDGLASDFDIGRWVPARDLSELSVGRFLNRLKDFHRRIMAGDSTNCAAA